MRPLSSFSLSLPLEADTPRLRGTTQNAPELPPQTFRCRPLGNTLRALLISDT